MAKIMALIPCLMLSNNREVNHKSLVQNFEQLGLDEYVIYDQCFNDGDFDPRFTYIGHADKRMGWVVPRNELLKYFYNSDFDYAFWIDANSTVSGPTLNDLVTIIRALKEDKLGKCDAIFGTLGMWVSQDRITLKSQPDFFDNVHIIPTKNNKSYNWMHGLFHKNLKKYYNQEFYIDERCDTKQGTADDVYFSRLLQKYTSCYVAPTVVINKPSSKASCTWSNDKGSYDYPPTLFDKIDEYISQSAKIYNYHKVNVFEVRERDIVLPRCDYHKEYIKPYIPRSKNKQSNSVKAVLF